MSSIIQGVFTAQDPSERHRKWGQAFLLDPIFDPIFGPSLGFINAATEVRQCEERLGSLGNDKKNGLST
jgi:hypothetical protein